MCPVLADETLRESCADKMLHACADLQSAVTSLLGAHNSARDAASCPAPRYNLGSDLQLLLPSVHQAQSALSSLQVTCSLWRAQHVTHTSGLVEESFSGIVGYVRKLSAQLLLLLQGCDSDVDSMVQEAAAHLYSGLRALSRTVGELTLATDTPVSTALQQRERGDDAAQVHSQHVSSHSALSRVDNDAHWHLLMLAVCRLCIFS